MARFHLCPLVIILKDFPKPINGYFVVVESKYTDYLTEANNKMEKLKRDMRHFSADVLFIRGIFLGIQSFDPYQ